MLMDEINFDVNEFKQVFKKKFDNFCKKAPILMDYIVSNDSVDVYSYKDDRQRTKLFVHIFDYTSSVKENIKFIKDLLLKDHYPILIQDKVTYSDYPIEELNQLVSEGKVSLDDINTVKSKSEESIKWRIERVIILRDEIFLRNLTTNRIYRYRMKIPVTVFLKRYRMNFTAEEAWNCFATKSILKNEIEENFIDHRNMRSN